ncbi:MAG: sensor histidine kinase [Vicinamibacterales bacterium]
MTPSRRAWRSWTLFFLGLTLLGLLTMAHFVLVYRGRGMDITLREAFLSGLATWYPWALLAPIIFVVSRRFPFDPPTWRRSLLVHLPVGVTCGALYTTMRWALSFFPWIDEKPLRWSQLMIGEFLLVFITYVALVSAFQSWHNYRRFQERQLRASQLETALARAELAGLKMQLQPHFLFNTLHAISTLIHRDPKAADEMITQLSDLLRITLDNIGVQEVSLKEELDFLRRYLDIQQTRFQDRLSIRLAVPPETLDARLPNQILQPIVENAIRHGLDVRPGARLVEIASSCRDSVLVVSVRDDGPGVGEGPVREGVGLSNTRARLRSQYGAGARLELANHPAGGLLVTITIPQVPVTEEALGIAAASDMVFNADSSALGEVRA